MLPSVDSNQGSWIVLFLLVVFVLGLNLVLLKALRKKNGFSEIDLFLKAGKRIRQPWKTEEDQLNELNVLVEKLKARKDQLMINQQKEPD